MAAVTCKARGGKGYERVELHRYDQARATYRGCLKLIPDEPKSPGDLKYIDPMMQRQAAGQAFDTCLPASSAPPLPADPAALRPDQHAPQRATEKRQVLREQQQAQRQHPYPQYGKEAEHPTGHEHQAERDAQPGRAGRPQPEQGSVQPAGERLLEAVQLMIQPLLVAVHLPLPAVAGNEVSDYGFIGAERVACRDGKPTENTPAAIPLSACRRSRSAGCGDRES